MTAYVIAQTTLTDKEKYQKEFIPVPERMVILNFLDLDQRARVTKVPK